MVCCNVSLQTLFLEYPLEFLFFVGMSILCMGLIYFLFRHAYLAVTNVTPYERTKKAYLVRQGLIEPSYNPYSVGMRHNILQVVQPERYPKLLRTPPVRLKMGVAIKRK